MGSRTSARTRPVAEDHLLARQGGRRAGDQPEVRLLVRGLLNQARASPTPGPSSAPDLSVAPELVVLDTELDGLRLLLIRTDPAETDRPPLSPREREIARMVARGLPTKAIAAVLDISSWTVSTHLRRMFAKYHVSSRAALVAGLVDDGLLR